MKFLSLRWKIGGILIFSNIFLGIIVIFIVQRSVTESLENEVIERGNTIAINLSRYTGELILEDDRVGLTKLISNLLSYETTQYILIQNSDGSIISDTFNRNIPPELQIREVGVDKSEYEPQLITLQDIDEECYDIVVPVEEGSLGFIRIGMKKSYVEEKVNDTITYIILSIMIVTLIGIIIVYFLANKIINPILKLATHANEISTGKLADKVMIKTNDEINFMAEAVERLRESLNIALTRLNKDKTIRI